MVYPDGLGPKQGWYGVVQTCFGPSQHGQTGFVLYSKTVVLPQTRGGLLGAKKVRLPKPGRAHLHAQVYDAPAFAAALKPHGVDVLLQPPPLGVAQFSEVKAAELCERRLSEVGILFIYLVGFSGF